MMKLFPIKNTLFITILVFNTLLAKDKEPKNLVGSPAPYWGLKTVEGEWERLGDYAAPMERNFEGERKVVVVSFFASWCQPCIKEIGELHKLNEEFKDEQVQFFLINLTEYFRNKNNSPNKHIKAPGATQFLKNKGLMNITVLEDGNGRTARKYNVTDVLPRLFVIDKYATIQLDKSGLCSTCLKDEMEPLLEKLIAN
jgi:thiol-disulfide isomerase/thioredoxin